MSSALFSSTAFVVIGLACSTLLIMGCGPSPEARAPVQMVRVPVESGAPPLVCPCDGLDEADEVVTPKPAPVEYVGMEEWQPPASARRVESEIVARGDSPRSYAEFPKLSLHKPIGDTTIRPIRNGRNTPVWSSDPSYTGRPSIP
jgi:hypothetical protein